MQSPDTGPVTSPSLLLRLRNREDADSWQRFEAVYSPIIRGYCRRRGIQATDIDDISQDVMTSVAKAIQNFDYQPDKGKFRGWLATVTANRLKNFANKSTLADEKFLEYVDQLAVQPESDSQWTELFMQQIFKTACDEVKQQVEENTWQSFERTWIDDIPAAQVAKELGLPVHTVYVNKSRILKRLEQEFRLLSDDYSNWNGSRG